jgi:ATP-dependent helicase YprA (DUF1998 family)
LLGLIQRETQRQGLNYLAMKVAVFHSSLTGDRRRSIIQQLQTGQIKVILSTSALEAGIDLPELDCCLLRGFPGSLMSFWQRVGRAGRKQHGLVIFLPLAQNPVDCFYGLHPQELLSGEVESAADFVALHSMQHQIVKAVPLVVLSSSLDVDSVVSAVMGRAIGYFFDTCEGGNGASEAIFHQLPKFAAKASALAKGCNCESGCPRCLTQHSCPQQNTGLHKDAGIFLLDAMATLNHS